MSTTQILEVREGVWIEEKWIRSAGLGKQLQVIVQAGEIRILAAPSKPASHTASQKGLSALRSLGKNAPKGKLSNVSVDHDRHLYGKR